MSYVGNTYELRDMPAENAQGEAVRVTGRFEIVEFDGEDPSVGVFGNVFVIVPEGTPPEGTEAATLIAEADLLIAQVDPERAAREDRMFEESMDEGAG